MTVKLRFAPSPTGLLHIGNIRTAVLNWLFARQQGGTFMLRFDDTDRERSKVEYKDAAREDLSWLVLDWDEFAEQSARTARYDEVAAQLKAVGRLYPCSETPEELERRRRIQRAQGLPPVYDRAALRQSPAERAKLEAEGRRPHWRFLLVGEDEPAEVGLVVWNDLVRGEQAIDVAAVSDPVLVREDGSYLYTFTSVVDDVDFDITHIVRGEDHVTNSAVQVRLFAALGRAAPSFAHHSLLVGADGQALSKRLGALSIRGMREDGFEPMAVVSHAALVGTSDAIEPHQSMETLIAGFEFAKISRAPGRFDLQELEGLNAKLLHDMAYGAVSERLEAEGVGGGEAFWLAVRGNLTRLAEARRWWDVVSGPMAAAAVDDDGREVCAAAAELLPAEPWGDDLWPNWTTAIRDKTGKKGRALFHPLRLALTGAERGPELKDLMPFMGRDRVEGRLRGETA